MFSNDPVANLNAANIAMSKGDMSAASKYLAKAGNSPQAINARGVYNMMQGNLDEAGKLLREAESQGVKEATANLKELQKKIDDNALFDSYK
jgi:Flp pilus assembly protein TadD